LNQDNQKPKTFSVGDTVTWTSQSGGRSKTKTGKVVVVVPRRRPLHSLEMADTSWKMGHFATYGTRDHESYLVQVGRSNRLYWPLVKYLEESEMSPIESLKMETDLHNWEAQDAD